MKKLFIKMNLVLGMALALLFSCTKELIVPENSDSTALLTSDTWTLAAHGFDLNNNHQLDPDENMLADCESDNQYLFHPNGTGRYSDNTLLCGGANTTDFTWRFLSDETELEIGLQKFEVSMLTNHELVLRAQIPTITGSPILYYTR